MPLPSGPQIADGVAHIPPLKISIADRVFRCSSDSWDSAIFEFPVVRIERDDTDTGMAPVSPIAALPDWLAKHHVRIASCRLPCTNLRESMLLEEAGFRFVEVVLHPSMEDLQQRAPDAGNLQVRDADDTMLAAIASMAAGVFENERYHTDPRLEPALAGARYAQWVRNSAQSQDARVLGIFDGAALVAFFVIRVGETACVEWLLTAVAPQWQGRGFGLRTWQSMLAWHRSQGHKSISTTIAARNVRVLNLYAKLGFRFLPPEMTFHWVAA